ncbi:NAD-dependent succinate-semialdehyde dehydrogenase [Hoeflea olei]|uniref:NAD-dependent succinate-semialdehyde dehydrogenase n=1 Tax=Hoeflea olei TaxID=1480615 RepID=A0A1C1YY95_9HYPH|nr:NAD-dependent succinate-semialdehyde dehydrogenase [Hoeflea olei]OCW58376.1 NAD-dependent succinate-semialdehyde dehydrogenase [Hoeflea olei]
MSYPDTRLFIDGRWLDGGSGRTIDVTDPATGAVIGKVCVATESQLEQAAAAAQAAFAGWADASVLDRSGVLRRAATALRARAAETAAILTREQGKPLVEARAEVDGAADIFDWFAEEARRTYGQVVPARDPAVRQTAIREPIGPVAAFTPWNFPVSQAARKIGAALAAGCTMVLKPAEETPASTAVLAQVLDEAGLPAGVLNLVYGVPSEISSHLIAHAAIRKISFTGSVPVGKQLAALAGLHMKPATMELGGHAPVLVFADSDVQSVAGLMVRSKFRNAGQVCVSPTRFLIEETVIDTFRDAFVAQARALKVGHGLEEGSDMGPLVSERRLEAVDALIADARDRGAKVELGGRRIGNAGNFYEPTVLSGLDRGMRVMNEEPFGPLALLIPFKTTDEALTEANRLPFGLASYAFTGSAATKATVERQLQAGMVSINHLGLALPETPFGGIKDSGYGTEGGSEAIGAYLTTKFITERHAPRG